MDLGGATEKTAGDAEFKLKESDEMRKQVGGNDQMWELEVAKGVETKKKRGEEGRLRGRKREKEGRLREKKKEKEGGWREKKKGRRVD